MSTESAVGVYIHSAANQFVSCNNSCMQIFNTISIAYFLIVDLFLSLHICIPAPITLTNLCTIRLENEQTDWFKGDNLPDRWQVALIYYPEMLQIMHHSEDI